MDFRITDYLKKLKYDKESLVKPIATLVNLLYELDREVGREEGVIYDFAGVVIHKKMVYVVGSGAFPVVVIDSEGLREPIMLKKKVLSEEDEPLLRLGLFQQTRFVPIVKDYFPLHSPAKIIISNCDTSHLIKITEVPYLASLNSERIAIRLVGDSTYYDQKKLDCIVLSA